MSLWRLIVRNLWFHRKANAAIFLGIVAAAAALAGALVVGDSVKSTLRRRALERVAGAQWALNAGDKVFRHQLTNIQSGASALLMLPGIARNDSGTATANQVQVLGIDEAYFSGANGARPFLSGGRGREASPRLPVKFGPLGERSLPPYPGLKQMSALMSALQSGKAALNPALMHQLKARPGDEIVLRVRKPGLLSADAALAPRDEQTIGWRLEVAGVLPVEQGGNLDLQGGVGEPMNLFVSRELLAGRVGVSGKANLLLGTLIPGDLDGKLKRIWTLEDAGLKVTRSPAGLIEVRSSSVFIPEVALEAIQRAEPQGLPILTYLANLVVHDSNATPYSTITAAGPPYTPADLQENEIVLNGWLAEDLHAKPGDVVQLVSFRPESGAGLIEQTNAFRVKSVVPLQEIYADKTLMPAFPGIEEAERAHDWKGGFPLTYPIRDKDEEYWDKHRGTPKAFVSYAAGRKLWANRFGAATAVRVPHAAAVSANDAVAELESKVLANLNPGAVGFSFVPVRQRALLSASQGQDFGELFLGFSAFLVLGALMLVWLLFQLALETRAAEIGTLLAIGYSGSKVRRILMMEALIVSLAGGVVGTLTGIFYARTLLWGLRTVWRDAVAGMGFALHASTASLAIACLAGAAMSLLTVWLVIRTYRRRPARELLAGGVSSTAVTSGRVRTGLLLGTSLILAALSLVVWALAIRPGASAGIFFIAGTFTLAGAITLVRHFLGRLERSSRPLLTLRYVVISSWSRRPRRSIATIALIAGGAFVIIAVSAFRLDARSEAGRRDSGTGGFRLIASANLPIAHDLNAVSGREALGLRLDSNALTGFHAVAFRVHQGEEASCLNLGRAQRPRLLGVAPEALSGRFRFVQSTSTGEKTGGWGLLQRESPPPNGEQPREIPAIGDANSIKWAMGKHVGGSIEYTDEHGRPFKVRIVGAIANSILQGSLIISEEAFTSLFPANAGHKFFLIDTASERQDAVAQELSAALSDYGLECASAVERLNQFNAVQNTYLGTFQLLGALGLLLGSVGLAVVIVRNLLERQGELAVLSAAGFSRARLNRMILSEHALLLLAGLVFGAVAAAIALLPAIAGGQQLGWKSLLLTVAAVLINGLLWAWLATWSGMSASPAETLRRET